MSTRTSHGRSRKSALSDARTRSCSNKGWATWSPGSCDDGRQQAAEFLSAYACVPKSRGEMTEACPSSGARSLVPSSARITAEVGFYLHSAGLYEDELPILQRAEELDPSSLEVWWHMGLACAGRQDFANAVTSLSGRVGWRARTAGSIGGSHGRVSSDQRPPPDAVPAD
jgi:hypothetical protein